MTQAKQVANGFDGGKKLPTMMETSTRFGCRDSVDDSRQLATFMYAEATWYDRKIVDAKK